MLQNYVIGAMLMSMANLINVERKIDNFQIIEVAEPSNPNSFLSIMKAAHMAHPDKDGVHLFEMDDVTLVLLIVLIVILVIICILVCCCCCASCALAGAAAKQKREEEEKEER